MVVGIANFENINQKVLQSWEQINVEQKGLAEFCSNCQGEKATVEKFNETMVSIGPAFLLVAPSKVMEPLLSSDLEHEDTSRRSQRVLARTFTREVDAIDANASVYINKFLSIPTKNSSLTENYVLRAFITFSDFHYRYFSLLPGEFQSGIKSWVLLHDDDRRPMLTLFRENEQLLAIALALYEKVQGDITHTHTHTHHTHIL